MRLAKARAHEIETNRFAPRSTGAPPVSSVLTNFV